LWWREVGNGTGILNTWPVIAAGEGALMQPRFDPQKKRDYLARKLAIKNKNIRNISRAPNHW
jgi:hypothetical protein